MRQIYRAMIIPDNLSPLPVIPSSADASTPREAEVEGFVSEDTIREILVGPMLVTPSAISEQPLDHGFAGRHDLPNMDEAPTADETTSVVLSSDEAYDEKPAAAFIPEGPHPALAKPTRKTSLMPRVASDPGRMRRRQKDHWWVLGMGVALMIILGSGAAIEHLTGEAAERSKGATTTEVLDTPAMTFPRKEKRGDEKTIAISNPEYPAP